MEFSSSPVFWVVLVASLLTAAMACWMLALLATRHSHRYAASGLLVLGTALGLLFLAEMALAVAQGSAWWTREWSRPRYAAGYRADHPELGYGPARAGVFRAYREDARTGRTLYEITYTITHSLQRQVPASCQGGERHWFLGDSITYGEGVNDAETFVNRFAEASGCVEVENLAFHGYGPHQALRILETRGVPGAGPAVIYYLFCCGHERRLAGLAPWERFTPAPVYLPAGAELVFAGQRAPSLPRPIRIALNRLRAVDLVAGSLERAPGQEELASRLLLAFAKLRDLAENRFGSRFVLLFFEPPIFDADALRRAGIRHVDLKHIVPERVIWEERIPVDSHPNRAWHLAVGRALARLAQEQEAGAGAIPRASVTPHAAPR